MKIQHYQSVTLFKYNIFNSINSQRIANYWILYDPLALLRAVSSLLSGFLGLPKAGPYIRETEGGITVTEFEYVSLEKAMQIAGQRSREGFRAWIRRYNRNNPNAPIMARRNLIEFNSLMAALRSMAPGVVPMVLKKMEEA